MIIFFLINLIKRDVCDFNMNVFVIYSGSEFYVYYLILGENDVR